MSDDRHEHEPNYSKKEDQDRWDKDHQKRGPQEQPPLFSFNNGKFRFSIWYFVVAILAIMALNSILGNSGRQTVPFSTFKGMIEQGEIVEVLMGENAYLGKPASDTGLPATTLYKTIPVEDPQFVPLLDSKGIPYSAQSQQPSILMNFLLTWIIPFGLLMLVWRVLFKRMGNPGSGVMNFGKNKAQIVAEGDTGVQFKDVAGEDEAKAELEEVLDFLKQPEKYTEIGGKIPKGVLLVGPPGTGKTLLAKAVAGEAHVPFFRLSGADFVEMFVGVGAARVRDLFKQAREKSPCIIFIDELDAIGKSRLNVAAGNDEREQTLNQLLVEMDGFSSTSGVIILAATNRPEILDPALLRPGRFDRTVVVDKPDLAGREEILKIHSTEVKLADHVDLNAIAKATPGFVGADLANIINEAALLAVRAGRSEVHQEDLMEAIEKTVAGLKKKNRLINPKEREIVAYHETGHALMAAFTEGSDPVQKITIVPRGIGALGYTLQTPTEDRFLMSQEELLGKIDVLLGGRAAEEIIFGSVSTGAANDISRSTDIAKRMITDYGMSDRFRNVTFGAERSRFLGDQPMGPASREHAETTQQYIDEEIARIMEQRYGHVLGTLKEKKDLLLKVTEKLLESETIEQKEFLDLLGESA